MGPSRTTGSSSFFTSGLGGGGGGGLREGSTYLNSIPYMELIKTSKSDKFFTKLLASK